MDDLIKKKKIMAHIEDIRKSMLPNETGSFDSEDGTKYSTNTGGSGFKNMIDRHFYNEFKTPEDMEQEAKKQMLERMYKRKAGEELKREGANFFGNKV